MAARSLPATPRLPPLGDDISEATPLVQGLWKLQSSASRFADFQQTARTPPRSAPRALCSISYLGQVANSRIREADVELTAHETEAYARLRDEIAAAEKQLLASGVDYNNSVANPLHADAGSRIRPVKQDEDVLETLKMREIKNFKVALPTRPAVLTITLTKTSGVAPFLWGSTQTKRPTGGDNEFKGKEDKLVYEHAITPSTENDGEEGADPEPKKVVAPSCREFYFAVDASRGECTFKLVATFGSIKMPDAFSPKVAKTRHGWEARLAEVTKTAQTREEFEDKLQAMQLRRKQKLEEVSRGQNFLEKNQMRLALETSPPQRLAKLQKKAILASHRREVTSQTRQRLDEEKELRHVEWMSRADNKRREREEQELRRATELQTEARHKAWLSCIVMVSFVKTVMGRSTERRSELDKLRREFASATVLHSLLRKCLVKKRRNMIWRNAILLRMAVTVYARTALPMMKAIAAPLLKEFVSKNAFNKVYTIAAAPTQNKGAAWEHRAYLAFPTNKPRIHTVISHYRASVMRIQRFWLCIRMMRRAYLTILMPVWEACEQKAYEAYNQDLEAAEKARAKAQDEKMAQIEGVLDSPKGKSPKNRGGPVSAPSSKEKAKAGRSRLAGTLVDSSAAGASKVRVEEPLPRYIAELVLYDHIAALQRSFIGRVRKWDESLQQAKDNAELENFLNTADSENSSVKQLRMTRPRKIYVDEEEIMPIVRRTLYLWHQGSYIYVKNNRLRIMRFGFKAFMNVDRLKQMSGKTGPRYSEKRKADRSDKKRMNKGQSFAPEIAGSSFLRAVSGGEDTEDFRHTVA